jgi:apolipoprotein N-acyltransferase
MGATQVGVVICFEVAFDNLVRDVVRGGGEIVAVQTNNATFGFAPMTEQQLAMSRFRAVEHGRTVLVSALAGVSAIVEPDGAVVDRAELDTQDVLVADVPVATQHTVATSIGEWPEWILVVATLIAIIAAVAPPRRRSPIAKGASQPSAETVAAP